MADGDGGGADAGAASCWQQQRPPGSALRRGGGGYPLNWPHRSLSLPIIFLWTHITQEKWLARN